MQTSDSNRAPATPKKPWQRPRLVVHGDAKALTEAQKGPGGKIGRGALVGGSPNAS